MKSYLRYEPHRSFGVIASVQSNVIYDWSGNMILTGSGDGVSVWNARQGTLVSVLASDNSSYPHLLSGEVQTVARSPDKVSVAAGYSTGDICIYEYLKSTTKIASLRGHQSGVSCLTFSADGTLLLSGGRDCDVVLWDTVSMTGRCRLRGHKDAVTGVAFLAVPGSAGSKQFVVSTSKDTLLKVWDLTTQHCVQTIVGHRSEIWSLAVVPAPFAIRGSDDSKSSKRKKSLPSSSTEEAAVGAAPGHRYPVLVTGAADDLLRAYSLRPDRGEAMIADSEDVLEYMGCVKLSGEKCTHVEFNASGSILSALSGMKTIEVFEFRSAGDAKKKMKRRLKRAREKAAREVQPEGAHAEEAAIVEEQAAVEEAAGDVTLSDCVEVVGSIRCAHKIRSFSVSPHTKRTAGQQLQQARGAEEDSIVLSMVNNALEVYRVAPGTADSCSKRSVVELPGHRSDVRGVALSTDGLQIASCSSDGVCIWSSVSFQCVRRCATGYGVSLAFAPGNRYVLVGTREGRLQAVDCSSGDMTLDIEAHEGALWSMAVHPDGRSVVTGGADKMVKFWDFGVSLRHRDAQWRRFIVCVCVFRTPVRRSQCSLPMRSYATLYFYGE